MKIQLPDGEFDAYIFDCDGTLADTMPLHYKAWLAVLKEHECDFPRHFSTNSAACRPSGSSRSSTNATGAQMPVRETAAIKDKMFFEMIPQTMPIEPVVDLVRQFHGVKPLAVASGA